MKTASCTLYRCRCKLGRGETGFLALRRLLSIALLRKFVAAGNAGACNNAWKATLQYDALEESVVLDKYWVVT